MKVRRHRVPTSGGQPGQRVSMQCKLKLISVRPLALALLSWVINIPVRSSSDLTNLFQRQLLGMPPFIGSERTALAWLFAVFHSSLSFSLS